MSDLISSTPVVSAAPPVKEAKRERTRPMIQMRNPRAVNNTRKGDPKGVRVADSVLGVGETSESIFDFKAARNMVLVDVTIDCKQVDGNVVLEVWLNGQCVGEHKLTTGSICFDKTIPLKKLDEIRLLLRNDSEAEATVNGLWFLYCVV